jgi:glycerol-3-phosphate dehydrogenase
VVGMGLPPAVATSLVARHGSDAPSILRMAGAEDGDPLLVASLPYLWAELHHAARAEMAVTLEDALRRRIPLFYEAEDGGLSVAERVVDVLSREAGEPWSQARRDDEIRRYEDAVRATRPA